MDNSEGQAANNVTWEGVDRISETDMVTCRNLLKGTYTMGTYVDDVFIRKGEEIRKASYDLLMNFRHDNAIHMLNYYDGEDKMGCIVIPKVDYSFLEWVTFEANLLFTQGHMTALFRNMIIELCDLIEALRNSNICLERLPMEDLYIKITTNGPKLLVLLTQVKWSRNLMNDGKRIWQPVKSLIDWCCHERHIVLDSLAQCFSDFIVSEQFTVEKLKTYPDNWDYTTKGEYLLCLISGQNKMRKIAGKSAIRWPVELPALLVAILDHERELQYKYNTNDPFDYIRLLRNIYKHFDTLPQSIKVACCNQEGLLKKIEGWTPNIWTRLYEFTGFPRVSGPRGQCS